MAEIGNTSVFSQTDANNNSGTQPSFAEGQTPSSLNDGMRALQGAVTREWNWRSYTLTSGGSADTQTLTYSVAPAAYYVGQRFGFIAGFTNTGTATLNVNTLGAITMKKMVAGVQTALAAGDITAGNFYEAVYASGPVFIITGGIASTSANPQFTTIELGHASDTTLARASAGNITVEGNAIYRAGGTDVPVADGGTGVSTLTAYAVICGGTTGTGAVQSIAGVGSSGQILTSNGAGALPTFQAAPTSGAWTLIETLNPSAVAQQDTSDLTGYNLIRVTIYGLTPATNAVDLNMQKSTDGSTYSNFSDGVMIRTDIGGAATSESFNNGPVSSLLSEASIDMSNTASEGGWNGQIMLFNFNQSEQCFGTVEGGYKNNGGNWFSVRTRFFDSGTTARVKLRFIFSSGNIASGRIVVEGIQ